MSAPHRILIIYNADATVLGKLKYGYRKLSSPKGSAPACAACDITHGGLSLSESPEWTKIKREIELRSGAEVTQCHRDEVSSEFKQFAQENGLRYPIVVLDRGAGSYETALNSAELTNCQGSPAALLEALKTRGVIGEHASL